MRHVRYLPDAELDLGDIWDRIAVDSVVYADRYIDRLLKKVRKLAEMSSPGRVRDDVQRRGVRSYTERSHVILFELTDDHLTVLRIVHCARDMPRIRLD